MQGTSNIHLYVMTHKKVKDIYPKDRRIMLVGAKDKEQVAGYYSDYDADKPNISDKNANYCELTGLYYFVNNDKEAEIFGLEHYRRLFLKRKFYLFRFPFLRTKDVSKIMKKYDIILPKHVTVDNSVLTQYSMEHYKEDIIKCGQIIKNKFPEYFESFNQVMEHNQVYFFNMFIAKRDIIKNYANWLFEILFELEKNVDISNRDAYQQRVYGFLSERLFTVWLNYNKNLKKIEYPVEFIEKSPFLITMSKVKNKIKKIFCKIKNKFKSNFII